MIKLPEYIYKYQPLNINTLTALHSSNLWFSKIENLNDPFEKMYCFSKGFQIEERALLINSGAFTHTGICSFTLNSPEEESKFKENTLMWSHYSSDFKGICLKFNVGKLLSSLNNVADRFIKGYKVKYVSSPFQIKDNHSAHSIFPILSTKHEAWEKENEYRFIAEQEYGLMEYHPDCIEEVYLGGLMDGKQKNLLLSIINESHPTAGISEVKRVRSDYSFDFNRLTFEK
ncbi:TPA: DUF2971 domain-containing protein [Yersinia enterocolitica]